MACAGAVRGGGPAGRPIRAAPRRRSRRLGGDEHVDVAGERARALRDQRGRGLSKADSSARDASSTTNPSVSRSRGLVERDDGAAGEEHPAGVDPAAGDRGRGRGRRAQPGRTSGGSSRADGVARSTASADAEDRRLAHRAADELQADRQPFGGQPAGHADARQSGQVDADGEDVRQIHLQRILGPVAQLERGASGSSASRRRPRARTRARSPAG